MIDDPPAPSIRRPWAPWLAAAAALAVLLPFVGRPLHVDDPLFVWTARHIAAGHAVDFYGFQLNWNGSVESMARVMQNPPGVAYVIAAVGRVIGWNEVGLHAAFIPFALGTVVGVHQLAARFCRRPLAAALLCLACPGFVVSATTLMSDVPLACLWVWAIIAWMRGSDGGGGRWHALSGVLISAAFLAKYPGLNLVPLLALHAVLFPVATWRRRLVQIASLALPVFVAIAYDRGTAALYLHGLFTGAAGYSAAAHHGPTGLPALARWCDAVGFVGGAALGAAAVAVVTGLLDPVGRPWRLAALAATWPAATAVASRFVPHSGTWAPYPARLAAAAGLPSPTAALPAWLFDVQFGALAMLGIALAVVCVDDVARSAPGRERRQGLFLAAWVAGVFTFAAGVNWAVNARTLLPLVTPACLLACRALDRLPARAARRGRPAAVVAGLVAFAVTVAATVADDAQARVNRRAAADAAAATPPNRRLWFQGHWGFQYYLEQAGATCVDPNAIDLRPGDLLAIPIDNYGAGGGRVPLSVARVRQYDTAPFIATMNYAMGAGFYGSAGDALPFAFGLVPPETVVLLTVEAGSVAPPSPPR